MSSRRPIAYLQSGGFTIRRALESAAAHGYTGKLGLGRYILRLIKNTVLNSLSRSIFMTPGFRVRIQRLRGVKVGKNVSIVEGITFDEVFPELITIEDDAAIAPYVKIFTHQNPPKAFEGSIEAYAAPVTIKKGAWICLGAIILPGVTIGEYSVVGAGSVVTRDVPPRVLVAGVPAKIVKNLECRMQ